LIVAWAVWLFGTSFEFSDCIRKRKEYEAYQALHEKPFFIVKAFARIHLNSVCAVHVVDVYQGAITALSGVAVAIFTFTLWKTTDRLVQISNQQRDDLKASIDVSKRAAVAAELNAKALIGMGLSRVWGYGRNFLLQVRCAVYDGTLAPGMASGSRRPGRLRKG
jgi:hypothetical protein